MSRSVWAVVPAAGVGTRMGGETPKQYLPLAGLTVIQHSINALFDSQLIERVAVALPVNDQHPVASVLKQDDRLLIANGGAQRADSVLAALEILQPLVESDDWVLVHDAARPCVLPEDIHRLCEAVFSRGIGGVLAQPIVDTVKRATEQGLVECTLNRDLLWRVQTPQMFPYGQLLAALQAAQGSSSVTDESSAMELAGHPVQLVEGSPCNLKVTRPGDLAVAQWYLASRSNKGDG